MQIIQTTSLEKVLPKYSFTGKNIDKLTVLKGEKASYQIAFKAERRTTVKIATNSSIKKNIKLYSVGCVPVNLPTYPDAIDDENYITVEPTIMPDILYPIQNNEILAEGWFQSLWVSVDENAPVGTHQIEIELMGNTEKGSITLYYEVLPIELPKQEVIFTEWFHCDCIASYYKVDMMSKEHWALIEKFIKMASENGVNMILTPIFTPPLDTIVGGERPTMQLVKIKKSVKEYTFDFSDLIRWIDMCKKYNIKYFEMAHLFTQWGAEFTPKIMADVGGEEKRIFGWDIKSDSEEYKEFLSHFLPALISCLENAGVSKNTYFHISDEPSAEQLESYKRAKEVVLPYLKGFKIMDAMSSYELYENGIIEHPVVAVDHIEKFCANNVPDLFGYYCCIQTVGVSNRFIAMPSRRNRAIAYPIFKYGLSGFLHWGYNFYYSQLSKYEINPFEETSAGGAFPSGDSFSVYPGEDGPIASLRLLIFNEALQDIGVMKVLSDKIGKQRVIEIIEKYGKVEFSYTPTSDEILYNIRRDIIDCLKQSYMLE
ncbi:MAG: DUF4091 domain-containing protein [Firmicutes bacterium]|nr:DUF4091 domain-containing protein [Bacillota bacterium]